MRKLCRKLCLKFKQTDQKFSKHLILMDLIIMTFKAIKIAYQRDFIQQKKLQTSEAAILSWNVVQFKPLKRQALLIVFDFIMLFNLNEP
jgi:hypothetical protein